MEILGNNLHKYFEKNEPTDESSYAICKFRDDYYEIWDVSEDVLDELLEWDSDDCNDFYNLAGFHYLYGDDVFWQYSDYYDDDLGEPNTKIHINGIELNGWYYEDLFGREINEYDGVTHYIHNILDFPYENFEFVVSNMLAKCNDMTISELWNKCQPKNIHCDYLYDSMYYTGEML